MILTKDLVERTHRLRLANWRATVQAAQRMLPEAAFVEMGTGLALFAGEGSPLTQVVGFANGEPGDPSSLEEFYAPRCENWEVPVNPFTHEGTVRALVEFGYRPAGFEAILAQEVDAIGPIEHRIEEVGLGSEVWLETATRGWMEVEGAPVEPEDLARIVGAGGRHYVAYLDGEPAATASMWEFEEGVMLGAAATRVPFRDRGIQTALLRRRLRDAGRGRLALIGAKPGTASYRNAQRAGFTPLYSTLVLTRR